MNFQKLCDLVQQDCMVQQLCFLVCKMPSCLQMLCPSSSVCSKVQDLIFLLAHSLFGVYRSSREKEVKERAMVTFWTARMILLVMLVIS